MKRPNLLFIYTDEQAFNTLEAYGNTQIQMPNLNRLAGESIVFDQAYVTQPVCTPSRASLLTGLYPHTNGCTHNNIPLLPETLCLPEMIPCGTYATAHHGKWHLGDEIFAQHGFDEWISIEDQYRNFYSNRRNRNEKSSYHHFLQGKEFSPKNNDIFSRGEAARLPEEYGKPAFLGQEASRFIMENKDRPFILYVNFLEPHFPFFGPRDDQYDVSGIPLPPNFENIPTEKQPLKTRLLQRHYSENGHSGLPLKTVADWQRIIANYWGLCSLIDTHIGRILNTLDRCGLRDKTIVVFTSDHGDMMGSHQLLSKSLMFEETVRVPLLIRLPGQTTSRRIIGPVSQIDLVPTLLDLMDQSIPDQLQGKSLRKFFEDEANTHHAEDVFIEWDGLNNAIVNGAGQIIVSDWMSTMANHDAIEETVRDPVRTIITPDGWKLNYSLRGEHELYNLRQDPHETRNLAYDSEYEPKIMELKDRIRKWQEKTGDTVVL